MQYNYENLEIIVSENDPKCVESENIVCQFKTLNIKYFRQKENIGIFRNFVFVLEKSSGEYLQWNACVDIYDLSFLHILFL